MSLRLYRAGNSGCGLNRTGRGRARHKNQNWALCFSGKRQGSNAFTARGFVKVIASEDNVILGAQIIGADASALISEITLAVTLSVKADVIADMIHPHPALSEAIWEACAGVCGRAIHK